MKIETCMAAMKRLYVKVFLIDYTSPRISATLVVATTALVVF
jgi:hypothetical protein